MSDDDYREEAERLVQQEADNLLHRIKEEYPLTYHNATDVWRKELLDILIGEIAARLAAEAGRDEEVEKSLNAGAGLMANTLRKVIEKTPGGFGGLANADANWILDFVAALRAENEKLRRRLRKYEHYVDPPAPTKGEKS